MSTNVRSSSLSQVPLKMGWGKGELGGTIGAQIEKGSARGYDGEDGAPTTTKKMTTSWFCRWR